MKEKREQTYKQKFIIFLKNPVKKVGFFNKNCVNTSKEESRYNITNEYNHR